MIIKAALASLFLCSLSAVPSFAFAESSERASIAQQPAPCSDTHLNQMIGQWRQFYLPIAAELRACGDGAVSHLATTMMDASLELRVRQLSARLLAQIGSEEAVLALLQASHQPELRPSIYTAMQVINPSSPATVVLLEALANSEGSSEHSQAHVAALGLAKIGSAEAVDGLLNALRNQATRPAVFLGLGELNPTSESVVDSLIAALSDDLEIIQIGAAYGLSAIGPKAESAIPVLANMLRMTEERWLNPDTDHQVRGMAAYALGKINPLHPEALTALAATTSLETEFLINNVPYYPEPIEHVRKIASEALGEIENIDALLNWDRDNQAWYIAALYAQDNSELIEVFTTILSNQNDPERQMRVVNMIGSHSEKFADESDHSLRLIESLISLASNSVIHENIRYDAIYASAELIYGTQSDDIRNTILPGIIEVIDDNSETIAIREGAMYALYILTVTGDYSRASSSSSSAIDALIRIASESHIYDVLINGSEDIDITNLMSQDAIGSAAIAVLSYVLEWNYCSSAAPIIEFCSDLLASPAGVFIRELAQDNPDRLESIIRHGYPSISPYIISLPHIIRISFRTYPQENLPALCQTSIAEQFLPQCQESPILE